MTRFALPAALVVLAGPALADRIEVTFASSSPDIQDTTLCDTFGNLGFQSDGPDVPFFMTLTAPASHCSDPSYVIFRPGDTNAIGVTTRMAPGDTQTVEIGNGFGPGAASVNIGAICCVGLCNTGAIGSWAVDASAVPVP